jgi:Rab-GTPase-TBC domain
MKSLDIDFDSQIKEYADSGDIISLRRIAILFGLDRSTEHRVSKNRQKVWKLFLPLKEGDVNVKENGKKVSHTNDESSVESHQIKVDCIRALHFDTQRCSSSYQRHRYITELEILLLHAFDKPKSQNDRFPHYYQGMHDIASLILLQVGFNSSMHFFPLLLSDTEYFKGFMQPSMNVALACLNAMMILVQKMNEPLFNHLTASGLPPHFALSWVITWFSHSTSSLVALGRIFDFLLASHPIAIIYLSSALLLQQSEIILQQNNEDIGPFHSFLSALPSSHLTSYETAQSLVEKAIKIYVDFPPGTLIHQLADSDRQVFEREWKCILETSENNDEVEDAILSAVTGKGGRKQDKSVTAELIPSWNSLRQVVTPIALAILVVWMNASSNHQ